MFAIALRDLKSPVNIGTTVRTAVAFGGEAIVFISFQEWKFKKGAQAFSRGLERHAKIEWVKTDDEFFAWASAEGYAPIAVEISESGACLPGFAFPSRPVLVVGNEGAGLPGSFLERCAGIVTIPHYGPVASLNVGVSAAVAMYEFVRLRPATQKIRGDQYEQ